MPARDEIFVNNHFYHIFNKTIDSRSIFEDGAYCNAFLKIILYYRSTQANMSYSEFKKLEDSIKLKKEQKLICRKYFRLKIVTYCLMPSHYHLLVRQVVDNGIINCIANTINSFTKIFNLKQERSGPLFLPRFKSVLIRNEEQLKHVSRYIHLNPYSSGLVSSYSKLINYRWSSLRNYVSDHEDEICDTTDLSSLFGSNKTRYRKFIEDNADYQRSLEFIKHSNKL